MSRRTSWAIITLIAMSTAWAQPPIPARSTLATNRGAGWTTTWAASPQAYTPPPAGDALPPGYKFPASIKDQTIRQIVHVSAGGKQIRIRLSNEYGTKPLIIGAAAVALSMGDSKIASSSSRPLTFNGSLATVIAPGAPILSDPVTLDVAPLSNVAISLYLPEDTKPETIHAAGLQTAYVSTRGNTIASAVMPGADTFLQRFWLTSVEVRSQSAVGTIVTLGDSITDGGRSTPNTNQRWPDLLAKRLASLSDVRMRFAVANEGIGGNALLHSEVYGEPVNSNLSALARFDRDVVTLAGTRYVILVEGVNDLDSIGLKVNGKQVSDPSMAATADDIIGGYKQIIERAHEHGIKIIGATIMPFEGEGTEPDGHVVLENAWTPEKEAMRQTINHWIIESRSFDGLIDFDAVVRDPAHPSKLLAAYDSDDHIHPNGAGTVAMANSINLTMLH